MRYKDKINEEKPREKLKKNGVESLTDSELLSILLRTGNKNCSVEELSNNILKEIGELSNLKKVGFNTLTNIKGIKSSKASIILASIELGKRCFKEKSDLIKLNKTYDIFNYYKHEFIDVKQEKFFILLFDTKMNLILKKEIGRGTVNEVKIDPREVFKVAIQESATFVIIMHNHPSGDVSPSNEDIEVTNAIIKTGEIIGIKVLDHIIISENNYFSFYENSLKESL